MNQFSDRNQQVLPTGTVTFLFTDIEGSTRLWEQFPQAMKSALERHDALLRAAVDMPAWRRDSRTGQGGGGSGADPTGDGDVPGIEKPTHILGEPVRHAGQSVWPGGKTRTGIGILEKVLGIPSQGYGSVLMVEFYQLKGDLLLALTPENPAEAEAWYQQALDIAQEQGARMLALQVAIGLTRLWWNSSKEEQGRRLLGEIYARFTEGFETADLIEARELLGKD